MNAANLMRIMVMVPQKLARGFNPGVVKALCKHGFSRAKAISLATNPEFTTLFTGRMVNNACTRLFQEGIGRDVLNALKAENLLAPKLSIKAKTLLQEIGLLFKSAFTPRITAEETGVVTSVRTTARKPENPAPSNIMFKVGADKVFRDLDLMEEEDPDRLNDSISLIFISIRGEKEAATEIEAAMKIMERMSNIKKVTESKVLVAASKIMKEASEKNQAAVAGAIIKGTSQEYQIAVAKVIMKEIVKEKASKENQAAVAAAIIENTRVENREDMANAIIKEVTSEEVIKAVRSAIVKAWQEK